MRFFGIRNVRTRLTLWYLAVLAAVLLVYGGFASAILLYQMRSQLDHLAIEDLETVEAFLRFDSNDKLFLKSEDHDHPYPVGSQGRLLEILAPDGTLLYRNDLLGNRSLGGIIEPGEGVNSYSPRSLHLSDGTPVRLVSRRHAIEGRPALIRLGYNEGPMWQRFRQVAMGLIAGLPLALGLAGLAGYFLAKRALSPIERMARRAHEINARRLSDRLDIENPHDELGHLAAAFNQTLARLEYSFIQLQRFTSDASHELRTPLTAIRSVGEVGLQKKGDVNHYREVIGSMLEETGRLSSLVDSLLIIARADSGQVEIRHESVPIIQSVREAVSLLEVLAEEKGQNLMIIESDDSAHVLGDPGLLHRALVNLIDNAIKYSPAAGSIRVRILRVDDKTAAVEVEDKGPGIPLEHQARVFDRFYRIDEGRSRDAGGAGLGLAIAKWIAQAHGGDLKLECPQNGGCIFRLSLPTSIDRVLNQ
jgi:heavy metal sensor kinase